MKKQPFEIGIDHPMLIGAKAGFDTCLRMAIAKAIGTGSNEGSATLKVSFEIYATTDRENGEVKNTPSMKWKAGYNVPMKDSMDAEICESSILVRTAEGYQLVNGQISMEELIREDDEE